MTREEINTFFANEGVSRKIINVLWDPIPFVDDVEAISAEDLREFSKFLKDERIIEYFRTIFGLDNF